MNLAPKKSKNCSVVAKFCHKLNPFKKFTPVCREAFYWEHLMDFSEVSHSTMS